MKVDYENTRGEDNTQARPPIVPHIDEFGILDLIVTWSIQIGHGDDGHVHHANPMPQHENLGLSRERIRDMSLCR